MHEFCNSRTLRVNLLRFFRFHLGLECSRRSGLFDARYRIIPVHTGYPGVGGVPVFLSDQFASFLSLLFPLHIKVLSVTLLFPLHTQKQGGIPPVENVGPPTFLIFPLIF